MFVQMIVRLGSCCGSPDSSLLGVLPSDSGGPALASYVDANAGQKRTEVLHIYTSG